MRRMLCQSQLSWLQAVRILRKLFVGGLVLVFIACSPASTEEDQRRIKALASRFDGRYEFKFETSVYLRVRSLSKDGPFVEDLREIYKSFWLDPNGFPRQDTFYVYINAYDQAGNWKLQLYWDAKEKRIVEARDREYY